MIRGRSFQYKNKLCSGLCLKVHPTGCCLLKVDLCHQANRSGNELFSMKYLFQESQSEYESQKTHHNAKMFAKYCFYGLLVENGYFNAKFDFIQFQFP